MISMHAQEPVFVVLLDLSLIVAKDVLSKNVKLQTTSMEYGFRRITVVTHTHVKFDFHWILMGTVY